MSERVITSQPIDSRYPKETEDADLTVFLAGGVLGFALALLLVAISFFFFGDLFSQAEQPLAPAWHERTVPRTPENMRSR